MVKRPKKSTSKPVDREYLSPRSAKVDFAIKLLQKKNRIKSKQFLIEGPHSLIEALNAKCLNEVFCSEDFVKKNATILEKLQHNGISINLVHDKTLKKMSETQQNQGVTGIANSPVISTEKFNLKDLASIAVLYGISDPGNAGTLIRTADAAGFDAIIFSENSVDPLNAKTVRACVGSLFNIKIFESKNILSDIEDLNLTHKIYAADANSKTSIYDQDLSGAICWIFGNEAHGFNEVEIESAKKIAIPIYGKAESLNVATAAAICMYETAKSRKSK